MMKWLQRLFGGGSGGNGSHPAPDAVSCQHALERVYEYLDDELESAECDQVAEHFRICQACFPHLRFEKSFLQTLHRVEEGECASEGLKNRVLEVLHKEGLERH